MSQDERPPQLEEIDARLRRARKEHEPRDGLKTPTSNLGRAFHLTIEMAACLAVGGGIGWFLDKQLDTKPWLLIVFLIIGIAAGIRSVLRAIARMNAELERQEREKADLEKSERGGNDRS
jgi:ATP synthase protein I